MGASRQQVSHTVSALYTPQMKPTTIYKGRGAVSKPAGRFEKTTTVPFEDGWDTLARDDSPPPRTEILRDTARRVINKNESPDIPHRYSVNPYRGCEHGCVYCFARPSHAYLGLSPGLDFETKIFAKENAAAVLEQELAHRHYKPQTIALGINTDSYQPTERRLKIARAMLEVLCKCNHPVSLVTKSSLIERDLDLLAPMAEKGLVEVAISVTSLDNALTRKLEPRACAPFRRLKIIENLARAGVPTTVLVAPIIPAVTDAEMEAILQHAGDAGAVHAGYVMLRLPHELKAVFSDWLDEHMPLRAQKTLALLRQLHGGKLYDSTFHARQRGRGVYADMIAARFRLACKKVGLNKSPHNLRTDLFRPPTIETAQRTLF